jgi:phenylacetate-CoA ligase
MIKYRGTTLFPETIYELLNGISEVKDYIVLLESNEIDTDELTLILCSDQDINHDEIISEIKEKCITHLRVTPSIDMISVPELRKIKYPSTSRKPLKLIDKRKKNY